MFHNETDYRMFRKETSSKEKFQKLVKEITSLMYIVTDKVEDLQLLLEENDSEINIGDVKHYLTELNKFSVETLLYSEDVGDQITSN